MLRLVGCAVLFICSCIYGGTLAAKAKKRMLVTEALVSFASYVGGSIKTARAPLADIYNTFTSLVLDEAGFTNELKEKGLIGAAQHIKGDLTDAAYEALYSFGRSLGGIDADGQVALCEYTEKKLQVEADKLKATYQDKVRMYWALPVLAALSLIILIL